MQVNSAPHALGLPTSHAFSLQSILKLSRESQTPELPSIPVLRCHSQPAAWANYRYVLCVCRLECAGCNPISVRLGWHDSGTYDKVRHSGVRPASFRTRSACMHTCVRTCELHGA